MQSSCRVAVGWLGAFGDDGGVAHVLSGPDKDALPSRSEHYEEQYSATIARAAHNAPSYYRSIAVTLQWATDSTRSGRSSRRIGVRQTRRKNRCIDFDCLSTRLRVFWHDYVSERPYPAQLLPSKSGIYFHQRHRSLNANFQNIIAHIGANPNHVVPRQTWHEPHGSHPPK